MTAWFFEVCERQVHYKLVKDMPAQSNLVKEENQNSGFFSGFFGYFS
jgi:hypothetical protein